mmetsp:Transcript_38794/g.97498  ORF Transcript_38794/g.97498 Transcript_38794/m.97498 type:complete len:210 (-) Transcript_38794:604-1233(-)
MFPMPLAPFSCTERFGAAPRPTIRPPPGLSLLQDSVLGPPPGLSEPLDLCGAWQRGVTDSDCSTTDASCSEPTSPTAIVRIQESRAATPISEAAEAAGGYVPGRILQQSAAQRKQAAVPLCLDDTVERATSGTPACPSVGSAGHWLGMCKPCDWFHRDRCTNGAACKYCHLCGADEGRRRRKEKKALVKAAVRWQQAQCGPVVLGAART